MAPNHTHKGHILVSTHDGQQIDLGDCVFSSSLSDVGNTHALKSGGWSWNGTAQFTVSEPSLSSSIKQMIDQLDSSPCALPCSLPILSGDMWALPCMVESINVTSDGNWYSHAKATVDLAHVGHWNVDGTTLAKLRKVYRAALMSTLAILEQSTKKNEDKQ